MTSFPLAPSLAATESHPTRFATLEALFVLTKPQLAFMSVLTAMVAYSSARPLTGAAAVVATFVGTSLAAAGALSLNQWWEHREDALMKRTRGRPLPQGRVSPAFAAGWSIALSVAGVGLLATRVNLLAAAVATTIILIYGVIYTPLKRRTRWATEIGALSGALPPMLGNAAAGDVWAAPGVTLTAALLLWQMPHFFAIGWRHRADYRAAGFKLLPAVDPTGSKTASWSLFYSSLLLPVTLAPWLLGWLGACYGVTAALAGLVFLWRTWQFAVATADRDPAARRLFVASIVYLPIFLGALALDRLVSG